MHDQMKKVCFWKVVWGEWIFTNGNLSKNSHPTRVFRSMVLQVRALWLFIHHVHIVLHSLGQCGVVMSVWCSDCCTSCSLCRLLWGDTVDGGAPDGEPHQPKHVEVDVHTVHCVHVWWRIWLLRRLGVVRDGVCLSVCLSVRPSVCLSVSWFAVTASDNEVYSCPTSCRPQNNEF